MQYRSDSPDCGYTILATAENCEMIGEWTLVSGFGDSLTLVAIEHGGCSQPGTRPGLELFGSCVTDIAS